MPEISIGSEENNIELDLQQEGLGEVMTMLAQAVFESTLTKGKSQLERSVLDASINNNQLKADIEGLENAADFDYVDLITKPLEIFSTREVAPSVPDLLISLFSAEGISVTTPKIYFVDGQIKDFMNYGAADKFGDV